MFFCILLLVKLSLAVAFKDPHYVENRTTMVHLFEWKWNDIADECEKFLGPKKYAGVQVSPINENIIVPGRPWWERYQSISYDLTTRSGNEAEFRSMVKRCNDVGVRIYVDAIINHMAANMPIGPEVRGTANGTANTQNYYYPKVPYNREDFHTSPICSVNNYHDAWNVRNCELFGLQDLDQSREYVKQKIVEFLNKVIGMGVAGFRIDAAKHMEPRDLTIIYSRLQNLNTSFGFSSNARPYIYQEVSNADKGAVSEYEYTSLGDVTEFRYGRGLSSIFKGRNHLKWVVGLGRQWDMMSGDDAFVFVDNHDTQRKVGELLSYQDGKIYKV